MAEWIGHILAHVPQWLFLPALVIVIILITVAWLLGATVDAAGYGGTWPFKSKREYLGEKKNDKK